LSVISAKNLSLVVPDYVDFEEFSPDTSKRNLIKSYIRSPKRGSRIILQNLTFSIDHGQRVAILGENGAGKTSLLRLIAGNIAPSSGELKVNGNTHSLFNLQIIAISDFYYINAPA